MVGVLIEMRAAITRRQATGARVTGTLALVLFVTLLAVGTLLAGVKHYRYDGAGANVVATLCFGWLLGWVTGPLLIGDDSTLRMDYFKLLPVPARKLAYAMLGAAFADVSLAFSLIAFAALIGLGALAHSLLLRWLAVPVAIAWAGFLTWYSTQAAVRRLESHGPEIFTRVRSAAA